MTYDDRDVLMLMAGRDRNCAISIQSLIQVPIEPGEDGPACHPQLIETMAQELNLLGLCCLRELSPSSVDTTSTQSHDACKDVTF